MTKTRRVLIVTSGLLLSGAVFGALASMVAITLWMAVMDWGDWPTRDILLWTGMIGAILGAIIGPPTAWLLLRRVPVGIAVVGTALGAMVAGAVSAIASFHPIIGAILGFLGVAVGLRFRYRAPALPSTTADRADNVA